MRFIVLAATGTLLFVACGISQEQLAATTNRRNAGVESTLSMEPW